MSVTKKQFNSNPRAKELRLICLGIAATVDSLLHKADIDETAAYAYLEQMNGKLIGLGITPHMQTGLAQSAYANPVTMAEYVAGQWMDALGKRVPAEKSIVPIVQEFSESQVGNAHTINGEHVRQSKPLMDFMVMRSFVNVTYRFLDAE